MGGGGGNGGWFLGRVRVTGGIRLAGFSGTHASRAPVPVVARPHGQPQAKYRGRAVALQPARLPVVRVRRVQTERLGVVGVGAFRAQRNRRASVRLVDVAKGPRRRRARPGADARAQHRAADVLAALRFVQDAARRHVAEDDVARRRRRPARPARRARTARAARARPRPRRPPAAGSRRARPSAAAGRSARRRAGRGSRARRRSRGAAAARASGRARRARRSRRSARARRRPARRRGPARSRACPTRRRIESTPRSRGTRSSVALGGVAGAGRAGSAATSCTSGKAGARVRAAGREQAQRERARQTLAVTLSRDGNLRVPFLMSPRPGTCLLLLVVTRRAYESRRARARAPLHLLLVVVLTSRALMLTSRASRARAADADMSPRKPMRRLVRVALIAVLLLRARPADDPAASCAGRARPEGRRR